jgi:hypothetical protein
MSRSALLCGAAIVLVSAAAAGSASAKDQFATFDPKGSIYTFAAGIDASGTVAGWYEDSNGSVHGFLRTSDGTITAFDPKNSTYTQVTSVNSNGEIAGWYRDGSGGFYSFVRGNDGSITKFNPTQGYEPGTVGVNAKGNVAGWYTMNGGQTAGFVGAPNGKIKQLSVEGVAINTKGSVTGVDGYDGFVRSATGKIETFEAPGSPTFTIPTSINDSGVVAGYGQTECGISSGFSRSAGGEVTAVDPQDSSYTHIFGINDKGALTGYYYYGGYHGFVRSHDGTYTTFDVPGDAQGTYPQGINSSGVVTGGYRDSNDVLHGFVGTP